MMTIFHKPKNNVAKILNIINNKKKILNEFFQSTKKKFLINSGLSFFFKFFLPFSVFF